MISLPQLDAVRAADDSSHAPVAGLVAHLEMPGVVFIDHDDRALGDFIVRHLERLRDIAAAANRERANADVVAADVGVGPV